MIDLHNHILPGVDDGPQTMAESLNMARQAAAIGTTVMAATPHRWAGAVQQDPAEIVIRVQELQKHLDDGHIDLKIIPGVEAPIAADVADDLLLGRIMPLGGPSSRFVLIEPPFQEIPDFVLPALKRIIDSGFTPLLAHPERNRRVQIDFKAKASLQFMQSCVDIGCVLQLTSGSLTGLFGPSALAVCQAVVQNSGWQVIIASDSHESRERRPDQLGVAAELAASWTGDPLRARTMVDDLPRSIISIS